MACKKSDSGIGGFCAVKVFDNVVSENLIIVSSPLDPIEKYQKSFICMGDNVLRSFKSVVLYKQCLKNTRRGTFT